MTKTHLEWDEADKAYIRQVFGQPSGQKFLRMIQSAIPRLTATRLEEVSVEALKKQGAEDLYTYIESLAYSEPELVEGVDYRDLTKEGD